MAGGTVAGEVEVDDPDLRVTALQSDRARLLIIRRYTPGQQHVVGPPERDRSALVVPGALSSAHAYRLTVLGLDPLTHKRVTGGTHLAIENAGICSLIVLTQDPLVLGRITRDLGALEGQHAQLHYDITARRQTATASVLSHLPGNAFAPAGQTMQRATANLQQARRLLAANDRRGAQQATLLAEQQLAAVERGHWEVAAGAFTQPVASAFCTQFQTLPLHYQLAEKLRGASFSPNVLAGGDMEQLDALVQAGWRHQRDPNVPIEAAVELSPLRHTGESSLHLRVFAAKPEEAPAVVETPPVWVTTPGIQVAAGKLARISGFVKTSPAIAGSQDGVLIFDSLGGQTLALRMKPSAEWQPFTLFRVVPEDSLLTVTMALTGLGDAWIDDVQIALLDLPAGFASPDGSAPEEIAPPRINAEELPAPMSRSWLPRLR
jgi:hypothetical protein